MISIVPLKNFIGIKIFGNHLMKSNFISYKIILNVLFLNTLETKKKEYFLNQSDDVQIPPSNLIINLILAKLQSVSLVAYFGNDFEL